LYAGRMLVIFLIIKGFLWTIEVSACGVLLVRR